MPSMFIPTRNRLTGFMVTRHYGIPCVLTTEGGVVRKRTFGFTKFHALQRAKRTG